MAASYSTTAKIRQEAGFQGNSNVTDANIDNYRTRAYDLVRSYVASRYSISLFAGALFTGSQATSVLEQCENLLGAGWLMGSEFQGQPRGEAEGKAKVDEAKSMLKQIASGELRLLDVNGAEFSSAGSSQEQSGPPEYTAPARETEEPETSERKFTVDDTY